MRRVWFAVAFTMIPSVAAAESDPIQLGGFFGPRVFSDDSRLGYLYDEAYHPDLISSIGVGVRVARPFGFPWFLPELELVVVPTKTTIEGSPPAPAASVVWLEPRMHVRIDLLPKRRIEPFFVVGGGAPIALSGARRTFNTGIIGEGYAGGGVRFDTRKGFAVRFDVRISVLPAAERLINVEADVNFGVELTLGGPKRTATAELIAEGGPPPDKDEDEIPDASDKCVDRPEDVDGFEDADGCPDIDNDADRVLDIADKCPTESETLNGVADDDGCVDTIPAEIDAMRGTVEGLLYAEGETVVRPAAMKYLEKIAKTMIANPSIKVVLVGHTDDREANAFATPPEKDQPEPDVAAIATDLARARAEAVRQALVSAGIPAGRLVVDGVGAEEPVADNAKPKGRLANRRVEIKLFVPR